MHKSFSITMSIIALFIYFSCAPSYKISQQTMNHMVALKGEGSAYQFVALTDNKSDTAIKYNYQRHISDIIQSINQVKLIKLVYQTLLKFCPNQMITAISRVLCVEIIKLFLIRGIRMLKI